VGDRGHIVELLWRIHNDPAGGHEAALADADDDSLKLSLKEGQQCQLALLQRWLDQGEQLGGWKIGMTSGANRNSMGDGIRPFGFILASRIKTAADKLSVSALHRGQVENELCFLIGSELGAGATAASAFAAVEAALPAFEINQKRLPAGVSAGLRVADDLSNWGIAIGEPAAAAENLDNLTVTLSSEDGVIEQVASAGHIDNHYESLAILANTLADYGHSLQPGQYVITGAYGKTPFAPGTYRGHFDQGIGDVTVHLTD
jgi:2-keto-4-pentenoate hydratase